MGFLYVYIATIMSNTIVIIRIEKSFHFIIFECYENHNY